MMRAAGESESMMQRIPCSRSRPALSQALAAVLFVTSNACGAKSPAPVEQGTETRTPARPAKPQTRATAKQELEKLLAREGVTIDKKKGVVKAEGVVTITSDFLEFVAIGPGGKKHEALVTLRCRGSTLNAALLALALPWEGKMKNVDFKPVEPLPTEEEVMNGAPTSIVVPPEGPRVYLSLSWHDDKNVEKTYAIEDLILDVRADNTLRDAEWIYFGGMTAPLYRGEPPVFVADYDQNYISTYYTKPDSHLITIRHARGRFDENWWPHQDLLPPRGTPCTLLLSRQPLVKRLPPLARQPEENKKEEKKKEQEAADKAGKEKEGKKGKKGK